MTPTIPTGPRAVMRVRPSGLPNGAPVAAPPIQPSNKPGSDFFNPDKIVRPQRGDPAEADVVKELRERIVEWQAADQEFLRNSEREFAFLAGEHWLTQVHFPCQSKK